MTGEPSGHESVGAPEVGESQDPESARADEVAQDRPRSSGRRRARALLLGLLASTALVAFATFRIDGPGLYYDELHQAVGAFAYVGRPTELFSRISVGGLPLLNMSYSGAIKSALYGSYLRATGASFSIVSWRLVPMLMGVAGILAFCALAGRTLPGTSLGLVLLLLVTDMNLLLQLRTDWGPVALAFLLRMLFLGVWLRDSRAPSDATRFLLAAIVGLATFEKLSSAVLLVPLVLVSFARRGRPRAKEIVLAFAGLVVGALPLFAVNLWSWASRSRFVSLEEASGGARSFRWLVRNYLALGSGEVERAFVFDVPALPWARLGESLLCASLVLTAGAVSLRRIRASHDARLAAVALASYLGIGGALYLLPAATAQNHWILGTPFHYLAAGCALAVPRAAGGIDSLLRALLAALALSLAMVRAPGIGSTLTALARGQYSTTWDPSLTVAAEHVARLPADTVFIAADWGVATQALCLADGRQNFVYELYRSYRRTRDLDAVLSRREIRTVVVATLRPRSRVRPETTNRILADMAGRKRWSERALDPAVRDLRAVEMHLFRRVGGKAGRRPAGEAGTSLPPN